jgi:phosphoglycolate phosphatase
MSELRLAVFDCDGTLVDSQASIIACVEAAWTAENLNPPPHDEIRRGVGLRLDEAIARLDPDLPEEVHQRLTDGYRSAFLELRGAAAVEEPLYPGIPELLDLLEADGWLLGIATGKGRPGLGRTLEVHGLEGRFVTQQTADVAMGKPHPDMLHRASKETGVDLRRVIMIGDTSYDILMARNAGVVAVGVAWGYHPTEELRASGADAIVDHAAEIHPLADRLIGSR